MSSCTIGRIHYEAKNEATSGDFRAWLDADGHPRLDRRVLWRNLWRARRRSLDWSRLLRTALRYDGVYAGYFVRSGGVHASVGDRAAARQCLARGLALSPLHVAAAVAQEPGRLGWMGRALLPSR